MSQKILLLIKTKSFNFENDVKVITGIKLSEKMRLEYKKKGYLIFKNKVFASDGKNNQIQAEYAEYDEVNKILKTRYHKVFTSGNYIIESEDITLITRNF